MALNTNRKIFPVGREVYIATASGKTYARPIRGIITEVTRGNLVITLESGASRSLSAQSRRLCLTREECHRICDIINGTDALIDATIPARKTEVRNGT